jgi:hypothetical protein
VTALSEAWFDEEAGFFYDRRMMRLEAKLKETDPNDIEGLLDIQRQIRDLKKSNA